MNYDLAAIEQQKENAYQSTLGHGPTCEDSGMAQSDCFCTSCERRTEARAKIEEELHRLHRAKATVLSHVTNDGDLRGEWLADLDADIRANEDKLRREA